MYPNVYIKSCNRKGFFFGIENRLCHIWIILDENNPEDGTDWLLPIEDLRPIFDINDRSTRYLYDCIMKYYLW